MFRQVPTSFISLLIPPEKENGSFFWRIFLKKFKKKKPPIKADPYGLFIKKFDTYQNFPFLKPSSSSRVERNLSTLR
jgi:hypothetical protein